MEEEPEASVSGDAHAAGEPVLCRLTTGDTAGCPAADVTAAATEGNVHSDTPVVGPELPGLPESCGGSCGGGGGGGGGPPPVAGVAGVPPAVMVAAVVPVVVEVAAAAVGVRAAGIHGCAAVAALAALVVKSMAPATTAPLTSSLPPPVH